MIVLYVAVTMFYGCHDKNVIGNTNVVSCHMLPALVGLSNQYPEKWCVENHTEETRWVIFRRTSKGELQIDMPPGVRSCEQGEV